MGLRLFRLDVGKAGVETSRALNDLQKSCGPMPDNRAEALSNILHFALVHITVVLSNRNPLRANAPKSASASE